MQKNILILLVILSMPALALGQAKISPLCTQDNALETIRQQVELAKTFNTTQRIAALIRAADLLWPYEQNKARAAFTQAFEIAVGTEADVLDAPERPRSLLLRLQTPDQRYVVIRAVARRDLAWAKVLIQQVVKRDTAATTSEKVAFNKQLNGERLIQTANQLLPVDLNLALELARTSLNYPASSLLTYFLYQVAATNQPAADQLYAQALAAYGDKPMGEFLYLQAYPFAWRDTLNTPVFSFHENIPPRFVPNRTLQRQLVQTMLFRAQEALEVPLALDGGYTDPTGTWTPNKVHLLQGLIRLEPQVGGSLPDLLPALREAREKILVSISVEDQKLLLQPGREVSLKPTQTFAEQVESAQKLSDVFERDEVIASAVLGVRSEELTSVIQAIEKISDSDLRRYLFEWFYFMRAKELAGAKQFDEAERLTSKIDGLEQRAFLHSEIAKGLLSKDDVRAREMLEIAIGEAKKADASVFAARTLLAAASVYAKFDLSRSIEVLTDAVACINRIEAPDFVSDDHTVEKTPVRRGRGGKYAGEYMFRFYMPGMDPESAFQEIGKIDFDTAMSQSNALKDKFQRAMTTLALADVCLQQTRQKQRRR